MRRPFMEYGKRSRRGSCRYQRIKIINEQNYLERVRKYLFPYTEHRMPRYRWKQLDRNREYFRLKLSGREVEKIFQFHRPFRGKASFRISIFRPRFGLAEASSTDVLDE